jgi:ATP-dependent Clp endopeptidase proteolytic subunit ClpP
MPSTSQILVPTVIEEGNRGDRAFDIYSQLLRERIVFLGQEVDDQVANLIISQMLFLEANDPEKDIYLYINSPGGQAYAGMAIYDVMQHVAPDVSTVCVGMGMSAAAMILCGGAAGKRFALPNARIMIHQGSAGTRGAPSDMEIQLREVLALTKRMSEIIAHHSGRPLEQVALDIDRDHYLTAEEARDYGIIDDLILPRRGVGAPPRGGSPAGGRRRLSRGARPIRRSDSSPLARRTSHQGAGAIRCMTRMSGTTWHEGGGAMRTEDLILVSVDDHVIEPRGMFDGLLPARYQDKAPQLVRRPDGTDYWHYDGNEIPNVGLNAVVGRPPEEYGLEPTSLDDIRVGCYDVHERVRDMSVNGVLGSMCFPSFPQFCGQLFARREDKDEALAMVRAYNDWHIDAWCGAEPGRFIPLSIPVIWDPDLAAAEVRRVAKKGCHAVTFSENPEKLGWPSLHNSHWDPLWQACADEGTIICMHLGSSSQLLITSVEAPIDVMISLQPINMVQAAADLLWSPILRKYKDLRFALSEGGIGWIPYALERIDYVYEHHRKWTGQDFGDMLPSQVFKERIITCFIDDAFGIDNRHYMNVDNITWECDYPHSDSTWPTSPEAAMKYLERVPDDEINKITHLNAMRHFQFDPFSVRRREDCTVGALRAEASDVDTSLVSRATGATKQGEDGLVSMSSVAKRLSAATER